MPFLTGFYSKGLVITTTDLGLLSLQLFSIALLGQPRFPTLILMNETFSLDFHFQQHDSNHYSTNNCTLHLKLIALTVTLSGFILGFELNLIMQNLKFNLFPTYINFPTPLDFFSDYYLLYLTIQQSLRKAKTSIIVIRLNLTRKCFTQTYFLFSNKNFHINFKPKRLSEIIFPLFPYYTNFKLTFI
ncbi:hypothetical protein HPG69_018493 [Diceros bicornis minor]|uniref:Uncharacterized protein n=1 Tax=Diceros bicornis minor TaxID=77932 RepID=A0A7J7EZD4_DICBM|nr:hypothetical protein HPG69_018493 [Diceros bicornis minor]